MYVWQYTRSSKDTNCWSCDHFQRYDPQDSPEICQGLCCFDSPSNIFVTSDQLINPEEISSVLLAPQFALVVDAIRGWCSRYERTREKNLPDPPAQCPMEVEIIPQEYWEPWNKKAPENISCWNCDHFQVDPYSEELSDYGSCRRRPMDNQGFMIWNLNGYETSSPFQRVLFNTISFNVGDWTELVYPSVRWCAKWERARHAVPSVPQMPERTQSNIIQRKISNAERYDIQISEKFKKELDAYAQKKSLPHVAKMNKAIIAHKKKAGTK